MPSWLAEIVGVGHDCDADVFVVDGSTVVAPGGLFAPDLLFVFSAAAVEYSAAFFALDHERRCDAEAEAHFFLVAEIEITAFGRELRSPQEQPAVGLWDYCECADFGAQDIVCRKIMIFYGKCADPLVGGRFLDKFNVFDAGFVSPEVAAADVSKGQPQAGVHGVVIRGIDAFARGMIARDLGAVGGLEVCEIWTEDFVVVVDIGRDLLAVEEDFDAACGFFERNPRLALIVFGGEYLCRRCEKADCGYWRNDANSLVSFSLFSAKRLWACHDSVLKRVILKRGFVLDIGLLQNCDLTCFWKRKGAGE